MTQHPLTTRRKIATAWAIHLFTASGAVFGLLAFIAINNQQWQTAFTWMIIAVLVDSADGTMARLAGVKGMLPQFDGGVLDNIIDYQSYVVIPAFLVYEAGLLPDSVALIGSAMMLLASSYQFAQTDAKTADNFFKGFPSYWNVVAFYLFMWQASPWINFALITWWAIMVFVPIKYIYPTRMPQYRGITLILAITWAIAILFVLWQYPTPIPWLLWLSGLFVFYYIALSLYMTFRPKTSS